LRRRELAHHQLVRHARHRLVLAAALALPTTLPGGEPFPARDLIIFLTFFVIVADAGGPGPDPGAADPQAQGGQRTGAWPKSNGRCARR
jgi:hypothetical protein